MQTVTAQLAGFQWGEFLSVVGHLAAAFVLALPIALERERATRSMGLRTFPLVALASCGYILLATHVGEDNAEAHSRVIQGLMTGIGFVGGGAIIKGDRGVQGTASAASIWTMGALGAAVAYDAFELAIPLSLVNFLILHLLTPLERRWGKSGDDIAREDG